MKKILVFVNELEVGNFLQLQTETLIPNDNLRRNLANYLNPVKKCARRGVKHCQIDNIKFTFKYL